MTEIFYRKNTAESQIIFLAENREKTYEPNIEKRGVHTVYALNFLLNERVCIMEGGK
jgi:hypothetical protein